MESQTRAGGSPGSCRARFLWAADYFTQEDYFLADLQVQGLPGHLHRGQNLVGPDGTLHNVRLKRSEKRESKLGTWQWGSNPIGGTREFNGLRVLMALMNNWDLPVAFPAESAEERAESRLPGITVLSSAYSSRRFDQRLLRALHPFEVADIPTGKQLIGRFRKKRAGRSETQRASFCHLFLSAS